MVDSADEQKECWAGSGWKAVMDGLTARRAEWMDACWATELKDDSWTAYGPRMAWTSRHRETPHRHVRIRRHVTFRHLRETSHHAPARQPVR